MTSTAPISSPAAPPTLAREITRAEASEPEAGRALERSRSRALGDDGPSRGLVRFDRLTLLQEARHGAGERLSEAERREVRELKRQDAEIRRHEAAHAAAGGTFAGAPGYDYTTGPDGKRYAVAGHVPIDVTPVAGDPDATIAKMRTVRKAALAPAQPSGQDRAVAAQAARAEAQAQAEKRAAAKEPDPAAATDEAVRSALGTLAAELYRRPDETASAGTRIQIERFA